MKYLLPCPHCGEKHQVDPTQAGEQIPCPCGRALEVPSLRGLRELEPVGAKPIKRAATAGQGEIARRLACAAGFVVLALGLLVAGFGAITRMRVPVLEPAVEDVRQELAAIDAASPSEALQLWASFRGEGLGIYHEPEHHFLGRVRRYHTGILVIGLAVTGFGLLVTVVALLVPTGRRR